MAQTSAAVVGGAIATQLQLSGADAPTSASSGPFQAMGTRSGEVTDTTAIVWTRLTAARARQLVSSVELPTNKKDKKPSIEELKANADKLEGSCPGSVGRVQVRYGIKEDLSDALVTEAKLASEDQDFICQFSLTGLKPATTYHYVSEIVGANGPVLDTAFRGKFETAPAATTPSSVRFCVMTCQDYEDRGHPDGHDIYPSMGALKPQFTCMTGDLVYYDKIIPAVNARLARYHWERMFSLPRLVDFMRNHGTYWLKDDHDILNNDCAPGDSMSELTFAQGQVIFRQQAPMSATGPSYRTVRWGRDLQVWFSDGRDFRSSPKQNAAEITIWGEEQKAWFKKTIKESKATWKVLVSPTPLVGPDRGAKADNHANKAFEKEGDELRAWIQANVPENFFVITGDRHWQYHSVHPQSGVREFSAGAASDEHAGGSPGLDPNYHQFHRVKGGFLSVEVRPDGSKSRVLVELRDVKGNVVHSWSAARPV